MAIRFSKPQTADTGDTIPAGIYVMWPSANAVPSGWVLGNGSNGTVDMRGYYPRGTPDGDTVNRTYSTATHTHTAEHSHTAAGASHCHTQPNHSHTLCAHTHADGVGSHCHSVAAHSHTGPSHIHAGQGSLNYSAIAHSVCTCNFQLCAAGTAGVISIENHPQESVYGCTAAGGTAATGDSSPGTSSTGSADTGAPSDDNTSSAGNDDTGAVGVSVTVDSCSLTTAAGSSLPPTRNVHWIMKT